MVGFRILDRVTEEMNEDLIRMRQASARVLASEKLMQQRCKQAQSVADEWMRRAEIAVKKHDDELAREALRRRKTYQETADALR